jgi:RecB family exonuclease
MHKQNNYINPIYKLSLRDSSTVPRKISYSQWSTYAECPFRWKLKYIDKLEPDSASIHAVFGTAIHETLQLYLQTIYTESLKQADRLDLAGILKEKLRTIYKGELEKVNNVHFSNPLEMSEFLEDGVAILYYFQKKRGGYFSTKTEELLGIEVELCQQATKHNPSVYFYGFVDLIFRCKNTNRVRIIDIKTSTNGWNKYQKADKLKAAQLVLYKKKFSEQYGIDESMIDVEFMVVKRKLQEESMFPQKRIQIVKPTSGKLTLKRAQQEIDDFVKHCFDNNGEKQANVVYHAIAGKGAKHCRFCPFKDDYTNCPKENRIKE